MSQISFNILRSSQETYAVLAQNGVDQIEWEIDEAIRHRYWSNLDSHFMLYYM